MQSTSFVRYHHHKRSARHRCCRQPPFYTVLCIRCVYVILSRTLASIEASWCYLFVKRSTIAEALVSLEINQRMSWLDGRQYLLAPHPYRCNTIDLLFGTPMAYVHLRMASYRWCTIETEYMRRAPECIRRGLIMGLNTKWLCVCRVFENNKLYWIVFLFISINAGEISLGEYCVSSASVARANFDISNGIVECDSCYVVIIL